MGYTVLDGNESVIWTARIDDLIPRDFRGQDTKGWMGWAIHAEADPAPVADEVVSAIRDHALPAMRARMT
jgi:hypothetical protein